MSEEFPIRWLLGAVLVCSGVCLGAANDPSLIGWWQLNEAGGTTAADSSGNGNDATLAGSAAFTAGLYGSGVYCDGTQAYVAVPNVLSATGTVAFWFKPNWDGSSPSDYRLFDASAGDKYFFISKGAVHDIMTAAFFGFFFEDSADTDFQNVRITAAGNITAGTWCHVAATWQFGGGPGILYLNGQEISRATGLGAFPALAANPRFGYATGAGGVTATNGAAAVFDDIKIFNRVLTAEEIPTLMAGTAVEQASAPNPADEATDVLRDTALSWSPGIYAASHDVYLGTTLEEVDNAGRTAPAGVLVSQNQGAGAYDPPGVLQYGQTYYWRVDEVNAPPGSTIFKGAVWSFTVEPVSYPITGVTATASSATKDMGPEKTVDGSGLNADGRHSIGSTDSWLTAKGTTLPAWVRYELPSLQKLDKMLVWNSNQAMEPIVGLSAKDVTIEYSGDGQAWTALGNFEFIAAPGTPACTADTVIDFGGIVARFVKLTISSNWGGILSQSGLSEVRLCAIPVVAREPQPAPDATDVNPQVQLTWRAGREAASHQVYLGADPNALTRAGTATTPGFAPAGLSLGTTYYWKVDEVNAAETPSTWAGDVWTFTTSDFLVVDDMESYNDKTNKMFDVWVDGYDTTTNGALVGYEQSANGTFGETTILHGGKQSMPLRYGENSATTSEATCTFDTAQDWTLADVKTLVLYFRGTAANDAAQLYLKINGTKVDFGGGPAGVTIPLWKQWNIDLASVGGVNFKAVKTVTIGVSGSGKGTLYIDDIRLYKTAPVPVAPVDPGAAGLVSAFTMEGGKVSDSVSGVTGMLNSVMFDASLTTGLGQAAQFNGTSSYVDLGSDYWTRVISKLSSCTFAVWVNYSGAGSGWQRVFDFGCGTNAYVFLSSGTGTPGIVRFAVKTDVPNSGSTGAGFIETGVNAPSALTVGWHHLASVIDATGGATGNPVLYLYVDGVRVGGPSAGRLPKDIVLQAGTPWQMWLGRSQWTADPYFSGAIDDLRVFNRPLSEGEIRYLAGDR